MNDAAIILQDELDDDDDDEDGDAPAARKEGEDHQPGEKELVFSVELANR